MPQKQSLLLIIHVVILGHRITGMTLVSASFMEKKTTYEGDSCLFHLRSITSISQKGYYKIEVSLSV